jgi:hypothetical protein
MRGPPVEVERDELIGGDGFEGVHLAIAAGEYQRWVRKIA